MAKYKVEASSVLDVVLTATRASTGHVQFDGRWTTATVIELSKEEFTDWERVSEEYHAWTRRIEEMSIAARQAGPRWPRHL